jgi:hypothetical protein
MRLIRGPVRGVVRHAAQQQVHGGDDAQQVHGVEHPKCSDVTNRIRTSGEFEIVWRAVAVSVIKQREEANSEAERDGARGAACAHAAAVRAKVLPRAVTYHLMHTR